MQKNADQVEKDILRAEELLAVVRKHWKTGTQTSPLMSFHHFLCHRSVKRPSWSSCYLLPAGCWKWQEWASLQASDWDLRQAGRGWGPAEGPLPGCRQSQEAQTPAGQRDRERVSYYRINTIQKNYYKGFLGLNEQTWKSSLFLPSLVTPVSSTSMSAGWRIAPSTETSMSRLTTCRWCPESTGRLFSTRNKWVLQLCLKIWGSLLRNSDYAGFVLFFELKE